MVSRVRRSRRLSEGRIYPEPLRERGEIGRARGRLLIAPRWRGLVFGRHPASRRQVRRSVPPYPDSTRQLPSFMDLTCRLSSDRSLLGNRPQPPRTTSAAMQIGRPESERGAIITRPHPSQGTRCGAVGRTHVLGILPWGRIRSSIWFQTTKAPDRTNPRVSARRPGMAV